MRGPRLLLLLCLVVGLGAVWFAGRAQLEDRRRAKAGNVERTLRFHLGARARRLAAQLEARMAEAPAVATWNLQGNLLRPAPPAAARPFLPPAGTLAALYLAKGDFAQAMESAGTSAERALVLLRRGIAEKDATLLDLAVAEESFAGTDLAFRARLEAFRLRGSPPDETWIDDVSALLGGPSHDLARALLDEAGVEPGTDPDTRRALAALRPAPGVSVNGGVVRRVAAEDGRLVLREVPVPPLGEGPVAEPLPEPFELIQVRDRVTPQVLSMQERLEALALYGLAALLLCVGTAYASVAMTRAHRLARDKSEFVANVTHELKTPLANIRLFAESLQENRVRDADRPGFLATILEEAARLDTLVEGLLHAARGATLHLQPLDPRAVLARTEAQWRPRLEQEGFAFTAHAPDLPRVRGDADALQRALGNLLDNARKYGGGDRRIELLGEACNGSVRLTVRDFGPGIPVQDRARVRLPFARLEEADRKATPGTGLGLSLVQACAEAHAGRLEIGGGPGAEVSLVLPVEKGHAG